MQWLRSLVFTTLLFLDTFLFALLVVLAVPFGLAGRHRVARTWAWLNLLLLRWLCRLDYVVEGREHLPTDGAHISYWKHSSTWETLAQMLIFPPQCWVLKREILWIPLIGWGVAAMHPIAINRGAGHRAVNQVVEQGAARLKEGLWILLFPEGTRTRAGENRKYGLSGALLASRTGAKLVPVAHDAGMYWGRRGLLKRAGTIRVVIGPPIETLGRDPRELNEEAKAWIDTTVSRLNTGATSSA
ncbi:MAG: lysophospholipid acyltransferase family protein [Steroidobacteraceae bacterium]